MQLADYQDAFARAVLAEDPHTASPVLAHLVAQPGFAVYRNTVLKGCIDALQANFPAVARLVGEEWFRAAAAVYARSELPTSPMLLGYGQTFAEFLAAFEPAAELPYLADVARVDRLWCEAHAATDDDTLDPTALTQLAPGHLKSLVLRPHAAARWAWCDAYPIYTLWSRNRESTGEFDAEIDWRGEGIVLTRPHGAVNYRSLSRGGAAFLAACADGRSLERTVAAVLDVDPEADLAALINQLLHAGAFARLQAIPSKAA